MPERSGPLDIKLAGLPFKVMQTPGARPGEPAKAEYVCKEVAQITDHFGGGTEPNYGDYPTSVESVYFWDDWTNGLSPTRQQKIDKTYWTATALDARRTGQLTLGPSPIALTISPNPGGTVAKLLDFSGGLYAAINNRVYKYDGATTFSSVYIFGGSTCIVTDLAVFNGRLLACAKGTTSDSGSGGTVTYGASSLTDTGKSWTVNQWTSRLVYAGGQINVVANNTATTMNMVYLWSVQPTNGTAYSIDPYCAYIWSVDGSSWNVFDPRLGGTDAGKADNFAAVRFQLWKSVLPNKVYSCLDPTVAASNALSWTSTPSLIGEQSKNITSLSAYIADLAIGKEDGLWSLDRNGNDFPILPELAAVAGATNCLNMKQWRNGLSFRVRNGFFRYEGSKLESVGLDRYRASGLPSAPVVLTVADSAPYLNELFVAFNAPNQGTGYIGALLPDPWRWHLFHYTSSAAVMTALAVSLNVAIYGGAVGRPALLYGFTSGGNPAISYVKLPENTDNPLDDTLYRFAASGSLITTEIAPLPDQDKVFTMVRLRAVANNLNLNTTVQLEYAIDGNIDTQTFTTMLGPQNQTAQGPAGAVPGPPTVLEYFFPAPALGRAIQFRLTLARGGTLVDTPVIKHLVVHYKHTPQARKRWELGLICEEGTLGDTSYQDPRSAAVQVQQLLAMRAPPRVPRDFEDRMGLPWSVFVERVDHELLEKLPTSDRWLCKVTLLENLGTASPVLAPLEAP